MATDTAARERLGLPATIALVVGGSSARASSPRHGGGWAAALPSACAVLLFSFLGMEGAAVATDRVRDPERNVPRAIVLGSAA